MRHIDPAVNLENALCGMAVTDGLSPWTVESIETDLTDVEQVLARNRVVPAHRSTVFTRSPPLSVACGRDVVAPREHIRKSGTLNAPLASSQIDYPRTSMLTKATYFSLFREVKTR